MYFKLKMEQFYTRRSNSFLFCVTIFLVKLLFLEAQRPPPPGVNIDNFTTCDEFLNGSYLDASKVIGIDWKIFYFWNYGDEKSYNIRFQMASPLLVQRFIAGLDGDLKYPVNWKNAQLFMETGIDFSALFIRTNTSGLYKIIPTVAFQVSSDLPLMTFALKLIEPEGYLGIANCKYRLCYGLAPIENMPKASEIPEAAARIGFNSTFGRSYLLNQTTPVKTIVEPSFPDDSDIEIRDDIIEQGNGLL